MALGMRGKQSSSAVPGNAFQFPLTTTQTSDLTSNTQRSGAGHARQSSRNFDSNWRSGPPVNQQDQQQFFTPGHRSRGSLSSSISSLQNFGQNFAFQPSNGGIQSLNMPGMGGLEGGPSGLLSPQMIQQQQLQQMGQQNNQQRKSLFAPYLPQATLPALLSDGRLVAGVLRVNKKNRSDAYISTDLLDSDIFICGSKDRNRALEGDLVAIELLDVDEVWLAKREKEEKKKRKDNSIGLGGNTGGLRRQGSIRDRPEAKKKDDVEVEGQGLLLVDEEEVNDDQKPMYAGHVVAVVERTAGQMFSGTLGLLRPSSAATKEKQDAERREREGPNSVQRREQVDRPKIVWFKPTDKRVPLIAIPTEQAPRDFVENHENYKTRIFVACIKRWPITSLHPFGTLVEELGNMGDVNVETEALLRDNNFLSEDFSDSILNTVNAIDEEIDPEMEQRKDFREERIFSVEAESDREICNAVHLRETEDGYEVGVHVADLAHFVKSGSALDREARKRGATVFLVQQAIPMLPARLTADVAAFGTTADRRAISVVFKISKEYQIEDSWVGKSVIRNTANLSFERVQSLLEGTPLEDEDLSDDIVTINRISKAFRSLRFDHATDDMTTLRYVHQLDEMERNPSPIAANVYQFQPANAMMEELMIRANCMIGELLAERMPSNAILRRQPEPTIKKYEHFVARAKSLGIALDLSSSGALQNSIAQIKDLGVRKALEILFVKANNLPKYFVAGSVETSQYGHFVLNVPYYTHFTSPTSRYIDLVVHRQLQAALANETFEEDRETLAKTVEHCNTRKDAAKNSQDQSIHLMLCSMVDKLTSTSGSVVRDAIVINVMDSSFDVLLPEFGVEKRVHLDQLPLYKAEFDQRTRKLELFWNKGVDSATFIPSDQQSKSSTRQDRSGGLPEDQSLHQKIMDIGSLTIENETALFDGDDAGQSSVTSKSAPSSPPERMTPADSGRAASSTAVPTLRDVKTVKDGPFKFEGLERRGNGDLVQVITELSRVPVVLQADVLQKSPPLLLVRAINPFP